MGIAEDIAVINAELQAAEDAVAAAAIRTMRVTSTFLDGADRYTQGVDYEVDAGLAFYAARNQWALDLG